MSESLRRILSQGLEGKVRAQYDRILDAMTRDFTYVREQQSWRWGRAQQAGWNEERVQAVLVINAFHRVVIGPLEAAYSVRHESGLGDKIPILFGNTLVVDEQSGAPVRRAILAYHDVLIGRGLPVQWLTMVRVSDILYAMGGDEEGVQE